MEKLKRGYFDDSTMTPSCTRPIPSPRSFSRNQRQPTTIYLFTTSAATVRPAGAINNNNKKKLFSLVRFFFFFMKKKMNIIFYFKHNSYACMCVSRRWYKHTQRIIIRRFSTRFFVCLACVCILRRIMSRQKLSRRRRWQTRVVKEKEKKTDAWRLSNFEVLHTTPVRVYATFCVRSGT